MSNVVDFPRDRFRDVLAAVAEMQDDVVSAAVVISTGNGELHPFYFNVSAPDLALFALILQRDAVVVDES